MSLRPLATLGWALSASRRYPLWSFGVMGLLPALWITCPLLVATYVFGADPFSRINTSTLLLLTGLWVAPALSVQYAGLRRVAQGGAPRGADIAYGMRKIRYLVPLLTIPALIGAGLSAVVATLPAHAAAIGGVIRRMVVLVLMVRLSIAPILALESSEGLGRLVCRAWDMTRGNTFRLGFAGLVPVLPVALIAMFAGQYWPAMLVAYTVTTPIQILVWAIAHDCLV